MVGSLRAGILSKYRSTYNNISRKARKKKNVVLQLLRQKELTQNTGGLVHLKKVCLPRRTSRNEISEVIPSSPDCSGWLLCVNCANNTVSHEHLLSLWEPGITIDDAVYGQSTTKTGFWVSNKLTCGNAFHTCSHNSMLKKLCLCDSPRSKFLKGYALNALVFTASPFLFADFVLYPSAIINHSYVFLRRSPYLGVTLEIHTTLNIMYMMVTWIYVSRK